ncbi:MAG TPA: hypothetical protein VKJ01_21955 [Candidatus Solibacter sp.]|jgi:hypothetical protein|nr:hypothetical protein [Candidatus Solibacter sp.]
MTKTTRIGAFFLALALPISLFSQIEPPPSPPSHLWSNPSAIGLRQIARSAGMIFSGTVTTVARLPASRGPELQTIATTFHVERALRGATVGHSVTIHEWAGLWTSGERYRIGERVLVFLYPPSRLGLTSPVGGSTGRFAVDSAGRIVIGPHQLAATDQNPALAGKTRVSYHDFARAVALASAE